MMGKESGAWLQRFSIIGLIKDQLITPNKYIMGLLSLILAFN